MREGLKDSNLDGCASRRRGIWLYIASGQWRRKRLDSTPGFERA
jgi:hypothetical protein